MTNMEEAVAKVINGHSRQTRDLVSSIIEAEGNRLQAKANLIEQIVQAEALGIEIEKVSKIAHSPQPRFSDSYLMVIAFLGGLMMACGTIGLLVM